MESILAPLGTPEQLFSLMLVERIEALEKATDDVRARLARLEAVSYDVGKNVFSDGSTIDWFVNEPVETSHLLSNHLRPRPMTEAHLNTRVGWPPRHVHVGGEDVVEIAVPVARRGNQVRMIAVPRNASVRDLLCAIHDFYATPVTREDVLADRDEDEDEHYLASALEGLSAGRRVTWADLVGQLRPIGEGLDRRDPLSCRGYVRFEQVVVRDGRGGGLELVMGS